MQNKLSLHLPFPLFLFSPLSLSQCDRSTSLDAFYKQFKNTSQPIYISTVCCGCAAATIPVAEISHYWNIPQVCVELKHEYNTLLSQLGSNKSCLRMLFLLILVCSAIVLHVQRPCTHVIDKNCLVIINNMYSMPFTQLIVLGVMLLFNAW